MSETKLPELFRNSVLRALTPLLASDWVSILIKAWKVLAKSLGQEVYPGMYEILDYDSVLELKDAGGKVAVFKRREKVKFLQDNVIAYQDQAWGDGELFAEYKCSPGVPVDRYRLGFKHLVLISLRETKDRGDVVELNIERKVTDGFTKREEWLQTELNYKTRKVRIAVVFPRNRPCRRALMVERTKNRTTELDRSHFATLPKGRQMLAWEASNPPIHELFTLKWEW